MGSVVLKYRSVFYCILLVLGIVTGLIFVQAACAEREVIRGTAGGALKGAAVAGLSDGDQGKGAAWGAAAGAARGVANKTRAEQQAAIDQENAAKDARIRELELQQAYEQGKKDSAGVSRTSASERVAR